MTRRTTSTIGFTLIEILIVVVIIGVLAVGLIAALDPFEQIRKAQDTTLQATARQVYYTLMRYRTQHDTLPWDVSASDNCDPADISAVAVNSAQFNAPTDGCLEILLTSGEMTSSFLGNLGTISAERLLITAKGDKNAVVCFAPDSRSFKENSRSAFASNGDAWTSGDRYYCFSD